MGLETGTYISDLVATNPTASDSISAGDDHIRLLKSTILATFPNFVGAAMTATEAELNSLVSVLSSAYVQQVQYSEDGAVYTGTTTIPYDDTIPQNTEGTQFLSVAITPGATTNLLRIDVTLAVSESTGTLHVIAALFQDSTAGALAAESIYMPAGGNRPSFIKFTHWMLAGTTSATTFKVRAGPSASSTLTVNGVSGSRRFGGVMASSISVTEYLQ